MPARLSKALFVLGASAIAAKGLACVDLDSLGNGPPRDGASDVSGGDSSDEGGAPSDPCTHEAPPGPPSTDDGAEDGGLPAFIVAIDHATLDPATARGFDLDGVCTCDTRPGSVADGGVDNAIATVAKSTAGNNIDRPLNRLLDGQRTLLLRISSYNGLANDKYVDVGAILSEGIRAQGCALSNDAGTYWTPGKCGDDPWSLAKDSVNGSGTPLVIGPGYVSDYRLVAHFTLPVTLPFTAATGIRFREAIVSGTLVPLDANLQPRDKTRGPGPAEQRFYRIDDGVLAGRAPTIEVLTAIGHYPWTGDVVLCHSSLFEFVRQTLCGSADITLRPGAPATDACDALSGAFGFTAFPALPGAIVDSPPEPTECADAGLACP